jgi:hypothetical protein
MFDSFYREECWEYESKRSLPLQSQEQSFHLSEVRGGEEDSRATLPNST